MGSHFQRMHTYFLWIRRVRVNEKYCQLPTKFNIFKNAWTNMMLYNHALNFHLTIIRNRTGKCFVFFCVKSNASIFEWTNQLLILWRYDYRIVRTISRSAPFVRQSELHLKQSNISLCYLFTTGLLTTLNFIQMELVSRLVGPTTQLR